MITNTDSKLSVVKQCELLSVTRGKFYYVPVGFSDQDLDILGKLDELYTENPTYGTRRMKAALKKRHGIMVGRHKIRKYMDTLNIAAIYPKRRLSLPDISHKTYPYLLRGVRITKVNQVWSTDITYIKLEHGFVYLTAVIDWYSRCVLSWRLSTSLDRSFCIEAVKEALQKYGNPDIFNTDQGSQYTSDEFTGVLKEHNIKISMDGKGRALDNIFVERLWRTVKYEDIYLKGYDNVLQCKKGLKDFFEYYNGTREHQSLEDNCPMEIYTGSAKLLVAA